MEVDKVYVCTYRCTHIHLHCQTWPKMNGTLLLKHLFYVIILVTIPEYFNLCQAFYNHDLIFLFTIMRPGKLFMITRQHLLWHLFFWQRNWGSEKSFDAFKLVPDGNNCQRQELKARLIPCQSSDFWFPGHTRNHVRPVCHLENGNNYRTSFIPSLLPLWVEREVRRSTYDVALILAEGLQEIKRA